MLAYLRSIADCRLFWLSLVRHDLRKRYRGSALGIGWALLHPLMMALVMCFVFSAVLGEPFGAFFLFVFVGLCVWNFFSYTIVWGCDCVHWAENYIRHQRSPLAIYSLRFSLVAAAHLAIAVAPVMVGSWFLHGPEGALASLTLLPALALLVIFGWAMATLGGVANVFVPETRHCLEVLMHVAFYLTPIIWRPDVLRSRDFGWVIDINPLAAFVDLARLPILEGTAPPLESFALAASATVLASLAAVALLGKLERQVILRL